MSIEIKRYSDLNIVDSFQGTAITVSRAIARLAIGIGLSLGLVACQNGKNGSGVVQKPDVNITLVGYAVPRSAHKAIIAKFAAKWQQEHQQKVIFQRAYGGSGSQTRAVVDGLPADIVHLALGSDVNKLVKSGLVDPNWQQKLPNKSIVAHTVAALVTRSGNPKKIVSFTDLTRPDVKWVTADPQTSGGARWNVLALWHTATVSGANRAAAIEFLAKAYQNVKVFTKDAREATDAFVDRNQGDALVNYENEIIFARSKGQDISYNIPSVNISIDTPVAIVDKNVNRHGNREVVEAFAKYLFTPEAQAEFVKLGYRPATPSSDPRFPQLNSLGTIDRYGGWGKFHRQFFDDNGIYAKIKTKTKSKQ
jgi:sulfate/thiosulfate transport system substrate-binding protein